MSKITAALAALKPYRKAIAGGVAGGLTAYVSGQQWPGIVLAVLGGAGIVYVAPKNEPKS